MGYACRAILKNHEYTISGLTRPLCHAHIVRNTHWGSNDGRMENSILIWCSLTRNSLPLGRAARIATGRHFVKRQSYTSLLRKLEKTPVPSWRDITVLPPFLDRIGLYRQPYGDGSRTTKALDDRIEV